MPFLLPLIARLGIPAAWQRLAAWVMAGVAVLLLLGALWGGYALWLHGHVKQAVVADRNAANAKATTQARAADQAAAAVVQTNSQEIERGNDAAKAAADSSADPLGDGLRSLRHHPKG